MKKQYGIKTFMIVSMTALTLVACKDEEVPEITNEEELITTLTLEFEDDITGSISTFTFRDVDGPGGAAPTAFDTIRLMAGSMYHVHMTLLNESVSPADDLTLEVEEEAEDHQVFYTVDGADIAFTYEDTDANGDPIGLHTMATTGAVSNGTVTITLKHQPGTKDGNITTGETDVEISFITEIE